MYTAFFVDTEMRMRDDNVLHRAVGKLCAVTRDMVDTESCVRLCKPWLFVLLDLVRESNT